MISASARLGLGYAERLLKDVQPNQFSRYASVAGRVIESNHPAFIYGHLSLYACRIIDGVGGDGSAYQPAASFVEAFSKDASCVDDPDGTVYPPMDEITTALFDNYRAAIVALESAPDGVFMTENPNEAMREKFPTTGAMHTFYVGGHFMLHMGQMSAWRRAMGMGPA